MGRFHELLVEEVRKETANTVSIAFKIPDNLKTEFEFIPGQYLTFKKEIAGAEIRRSYSICSSKSEDLVRVAVKQIADGLFSTFANQSLKSGDKLEVMEPDGSFCPINIDSEIKNYLLVAAGSGITPLLSIAKSILEEGQGSVIVLYGNKNEESVIFKDQLDQLLNQYAERFKLINVFSENDAAEHKGRINKERIVSLGQILIDYKQIDSAFICGPEEMIFQVSDQLEKEGVKKSNIHFELFTTPVITENDKLAIGPERQDAEMTVIIDDDEYEFTMTSQFDSILDAAMDAGADVPFACKGGVCCTCKAKVIEGEVHMKVNYGLEDYEVENGFVLTCQCVPISDNVVVNYDINS
jgi:ring-1,2-phenylacetyl-CoA epoxidase subunit PaaE